MQVIFDFHGGPRDGERLTGNLDGHAPTEASNFYRHTDNASVGARFWCTCEYGVAALRTIPWTDIEQLESAGYRFRGHVYEVVERREREGAVHARVRYAAPSE